MNFGLLGALVFGYIGVSWINRIMGAQMFVTEDTAILAQLALTQEVDLGLFTLNIPFAGFVSALTKMADWEQYTVWGQLGQYIMVFLYAMSILTLFGIFVTLLTGAVNFFRPR